MKQAIWKVVPDGSFEFRGHNRLQGVLFGPEASTAPLSSQLREKFGGISIPIEAIEQFVMTDETVFHTGQSPAEDAVQPMLRKGWAR